MNPTRNVRIIEVEDDVFKQLCLVRHRELVECVRKEYHRLRDQVNVVITGRWMKIKDSDVYLETKNKVLFPDTRKLKATDLRDCRTSGSYKEYAEQVANYNSGVLEKMKKQAEEKNWQIPTDFETEIGGIEAQGMTPEMVRELFDERSRCPCFREDGLELEDGKTYAYVLTTGTNQASVCDIRYLSFYGMGDAAVKISIHRFPSTMPVFDIIVKYGFYPEKLDDETVEALKEFHEIAKDGVDFDNADSVSRYFYENKIEKFLEYDFRAEAIAIDVESEEIDLKAEEGMGHCLKEYYDLCDYKRARIQSYNSKWYLSDEGKGHWELWGEPKGQSSAKESADGDKKEKEEIFAPKKILKLKNGVIARNPAADIKHDAVVGIDFGTKSTIVALQDGDEQIVPLRVGMADYSVAPEASHFENPTVMQFVNLSRFVEQYEKYPGRPLTSWDDLLISHEAFKNLIGASESTDYAAFISDMKQWAAGRYDNNGKDGHLIIKDAKGHRYDIDNYMELTDEDIDLVELYAYYIGLFINNMHMGIYLDYIMSFPETFSMEVKQHILESFTKGIRKSLPAIVLDNPEYEEEFRVRQGPSEPAAYAACALEQYGIEPTDEGEFYGIFDFGGGTTDYDYGIWMNAPEDEYTYNYVIKHYGSGGDKTLGGENILQLLAYEVFSDDKKHGNEESNRDIMRRLKLVYYKPEDGKVYSGMEALNNNSESALLNTKQMMEALRPIWEEWDEVQEWFDNGNTSFEVLGLLDNGNKSFELEVGNHVTLSFGNELIKAKLNLFSDVGRESVELYVDMEMINQVINQRIDVGVRNFFEGLEQAYVKWDDRTYEKIHIFLAGNSSKSKRVTRLFQDVELGETLSEAGFILYPPLGTKEAREIQKERCMDVEEGDLMAPTGKTGVAFGLVMCREGSMIKVESEKKKDEQIKLNYYIGVNYRKNFKMIFERSIEYNTWLKFCKVAADTETFEFYYSELPEVVKGEVAIKGNKSIYKHKCLLDNVTDDANIYFRFITPTQLEYVASSDDIIKEGQYFSKVYTVKL